MEKMTVATESTNYPLFLGAGLRFRVGEFIEQISKSPTSVLIVTDDIVAPLYLNDLVQSLHIENIHSYIIPNGEQSKSFHLFYELQSYAIECNLDRHSLIIALGGGVVGDLAGFVAATFMRGIPYVQVPTTLLAHDSAVGGKVAINHEQGKNLIGSFHHPACVIYDVDTLQSLPKRQLLSGLAEVIKHALIADLSFLTQLQTNLPESLYDDEELRRMLVKAISIKAKVVANDEKEKGERMHLNFGHTLAHAIEVEMEYDWLHGEAVIVGMLFAIAVSETYYNVDLNLNEMKKWLTQLGYSTKIPSSLTVDQLLNRLMNDKKVNGQLINMVLLSDIGQPQVVALTRDYLNEQLMRFHS
jgi:3-dehydroquinate synthase